MSKKARRESSGCFASVRPALTQSVEQPDEDAPGDMSADIIASFIGVGTAIAMLFLSRPVRDAA